MFWLKKVISYWLMPLPLSLVLLVAGATLEFVGRRLRLGRAFVAAGVIILLLSGNRWVSMEVLSRLESAYPPAPRHIAAASPASPLLQCHYVVVLGGGSNGHTSGPAISRLSSAALGRIVEGVRLLRELPGATLIVSGPAEPGQPTHARILADSAESLGVSPRDIALIETALDTEDEGKAVAAIVGQAPVALVTSAWHMPRAMRLFRKAGVHAIACPADFSSGEASELGWKALGWDTQSIERSTLAAHEILGIIWLRLRAAD